MIEERAAQSTREEILPNGRRRPTVESYSLTLVYTFFHSVDGEQRQQRLGVANTRWTHWLDRYPPTPVAATASDASREEASEPLADLAAVLDDTYFFLPHVRTLLYPETELLNIEKPEWLNTYGQGISSDKQPQHTIDEEKQKWEPARRVKAWLDKSPLVHLSSSDDAEKPQVQKRIADAFAAGVLRLTLREDQRKAIENLILCVPDKKAKANKEWQKPEIRFTIEWADVVLFPQQVGFLALKVVLPDAVSTDDLTWFWNNARYVYPPKLTLDEPRLRIGSTTSGPDLGHPQADGDTSRTGQTNEFSWRSLVEFLLQEFVGPTEPKQLLSDPTAPSLHRYTLEDAAQVYGSTFRLYGHVVVTDRTKCFLTNIAGEGQPFTNLGEKVLFELTSSHDTGDPDWVPSSVFMERLRQVGIVNYWQGWQALLMWENMIFLADDSPFARSVLPYNVEGDYFSLYLLARFDQVRLQRMAGQIIRKGSALVDDVTYIQGLAAELITFRNLYWFREVTTTPLGAYLYQILQQSFDLDELHRSVSDELTTVRNHFEAEYRSEQQSALELQSKAQSRLSFLVTLLTIVLVPTGVVLQVFSSQLKYWPLVQAISPAASQLYTIIFTLVLLIIAILFRYFRPFHRRNNTQRQIRRKDHAITPQLGEGS